MYEIIESSWKSVLKKELEKAYFTELTNIIKASYINQTIYPAPRHIFRAFAFCPFNKLKVVILGQDPYHGEGQAHGLAFSVPEGVAIPPSLRNIYKEIESDIGKKMPDTGNLERWSKQGVLLLNTTLTVKSGQPMSHQGLGWETFTDAVIKTISDQKDHAVFLLWGKHAQAKETLIDGHKHLILQAPHPSPFSARSGFFGCKHFSKTNAYLEKNDQQPIKW